jgi:hypothetical protein
MTGELNIMLFEDIMISFFISDRKEPFNLKEIETIGSKQVNTCAILFDVSQFVFRELSNKLSKM